ncbi:FAST kinase domain-containing protein 1, mitochondrial isoform X2 [Kryptolebias marmoratus]|uniref:FAST kinase domain-containing protein 1, mitochondrial isoform X2 n=1 Tax=Kryptolebias marmoratus TaxID=37003 RepID=UPI0007F8D925|nr:FAST kinase domain-containing protein 1, mitochondrial isoform X2 [Kryptolebias marmoratus]
MFRLRCVNPCLRRLLHVGAINRDQILEGLQVCSTEDQVFDVVSRNKAKLTVDHVGCAVRMLWDFQKDRPCFLRTIDLTNSHPQFVTLQVLAENKITQMDDLTLVDVLYAFLRLKVEPQNSVVQQIVSEAWLRIDRLPMSSLSKLAVCLFDQQLQTSPLMGRITSILDQKLTTIDDLRILSILMNTVTILVSPRLRDALISRANHLLNSPRPLAANTPRRLVQFMRNFKYMDRPLLEKCNRVFMHNISRMDADDISIILGLYQSLQFNNCDFRLAAKERLIELINISTGAFSFCKLFVALAPTASMKIRERLDNMAYLLADELNPQQVRAILEVLEEIQSRNLSLLNNSAELTRITRTLVLLHYQNSELFATLRKLLLSFLQKSFYPSEVVMLTRVLSMLPSPRLDKDVVSRLDEVVAQCNLHELTTVSFAISKWIQKEPFYRHNTHSKYIRLLQRLSHCGCERLQTADQLDLVMDELKFVSGEWFEEMLLEDAIVTVSRMIDQINWNNVSDLGFFLTRMNYFHQPLLDRIASVAVEHIDKIHFSATYATLLPFSVMNYEPPQADELYDACIKHFTPHMSSFEPHLLVLLAFSLAVAGRFPEELVRKIFSIDFLGKLDLQLECLPNNLNMRTRQRLMELNRALCLECPEFQVPWFHEHYCQQLKKKENVTISPLQQQIHKMLVEVLGGINFVQVAVVTPYYYTVDFECKLDKHLKPLCYSEPSSLQISSKGKVVWESGSPKNTREELPPGAQRIAVDFLDSRLFCKNSHHIKSEALIRKRHLEILGYRVVQIPHFEWNSLELSTADAWKDYLKQKILGQGCL